MLIFCSWITNNLTNFIILCKIKNVDWFSVSNRSDWRSRFNTRKSWINVWLCMFPVCPVSVAYMMKHIVFFIININNPLRISQCTKAFSSSCCQNKWFSVFPACFLGGISMDEFSWLIPIVKINMRFKTNAGRIFYSYVFVKNLTFMFPVSPVTNKVMNEFIFIIDIIRIDGFCLTHNCSGGGCILIQQLFPISPLSVGIGKIMPNCFIGLS